MVADVSPWRDLALREIGSVKARFRNKHGWVLTTVEHPDRIELYVQLHHRTHPERIKVFRLVYGPGFPQERPHEGFVDPDNWDNEGTAYWIADGGQAFKTTHNPPVICLEGTWGFHSILHRNRDPLKANLNRLLLEIQSCFDKT